MLTPSYMLANCFPSVKRVFVSLVSYMNTGLGDTSICLKLEGTVPIHTSSDEVEQ